MSELLENLEDLNALLNNNAIRLAGNKIIFPMLDYYNKKMGGIHLPTIVGAAAALTGERALTALHPEMAREKPQYIRSEKVEDFIFRGKNYSLTIADILLYFGALAENKVSTDLYNDIVIRTTRNFGANVPAMSVGSEYLPEEWSPNAMCIFRARVDFVSTSMNIKGDYLAYTLAIGVGDVIDMADSYSNGIEARRALTKLSLEIIYGCACMVPLRSMIEISDET